MAHFFVKNYELIEHTADIGARIKASSLPILFINAAASMFDIIAEKKQGTGGRGQRVEKFIVKQAADNREELFVNWLNELLSLSAIKEKIFCDFVFKKFNENSLLAEVTGCDIQDYKINTEIKAATYHELKLAQTGSGWQAEVIFDV